jgi:hypothetical protein
MATLRTIIKTRPVFLYLLPLFFVLHGYTENYDFVPVKDAALLTAVYWGASLVISLLSWLIYRNFIKANLFAFCVMALHFFFGSMHDFLKRLAPGGFISKYSFVLPAIAIIFIVLLVLLKKRKKTLFATTRFLNMLLFLLILVDVAILTGKTLKREKSSLTPPQGLTDCGSCPKPDIYFILADEYAGNTELKDLFHFDDSLFINQLASRNFHTIPQSFSNYNYTPFSLASILNMDYLQLEGKERGRPDLTYSYDQIKNNKVLQYLRSQGYQFYNYSVFDFEGQPARTRETFLPAKTRLITSQTFLSRFDRDIRFNLVTRWKSKSNLRIITYANKKNNENIFALTKEISAQKSSSPKFVYTHLMMPHYPYFFDKNGNEQPFEKLLEGNQLDKQAYIEYLQYGNKKLLELVDHIQKSSASPPIIVLMGDHGFRHFTEPVPSKYYFLNLVSVHLPGNNYTSLNDSLSGVNIFRAIFNNSFRQQLPYLKDSTIYLTD